MANRDNHYEAAFEEFLRQHCVPYVAVDEAKRSLMAGTSLKSLDFIVSAPRGRSWLVDVKGRRFPSGEQKQYWKNWSTRDDLWSLAQWERLFGDRFGGLFVFAFLVHGDRSPLPAEEMFIHRGRPYGFVGVALRDYAYYARPISPKWDTVAVSNRRFRQLARPMARLLSDDGADSVEFSATGGSPRPQALSTMGSPRDSAHESCAQPAAWASAGR